MNTFADTLKRLRTEKGLTQEQLAGVLHTTKQAISHYERGTRAPKRELYETMADYFNVDMNYLLGYESRTTRLLSDDELRLVNAYRSANDDLRKAAHAVLNTKTL